MILVRRVINRMDIERKDNVFKVSIPAITDDEIRVIDNNFDEIAHKFSEMIMHDKDLIMAQRVIQNQQAELDKKDMIINEMAKELTEWIGTCPLDKYDWQVLDCDKVCDNQMKHCWIEYFTKKVEGK